MPPRMVPLLRCAHRRMDRCSFSSVSGAAATLRSPLLSRRLVQAYEKEQRAAARTAAKTKVPPKEKAADTPWPRNVVYSAYAAAAIFIPYTLAWFVSSDQRWRNLLIPDDDEDANESSSASSVVIHALRQHFGVPDRECLSEPETLCLREDSMPHKFVDEPTRRIRREQAWVHRFQRQGIVHVKITSRRITEEVEEEPDSQVLHLPAHTLARAEDMNAALQNHVTIRPPLALDFLDDDGEESKESGAVTPEPHLDPTPVVPALSIYSLWHYQPPPPPAPAASSSSKSMSPTALELSRLNYEMDRLREELLSSSSARPIDDIQAELAALRQQKRQVQWRNLWSSWH